MYLTSNTVSCTWYYDAILPNGKRVEIMIRDNKIYWRYLRNDKINLKWKYIRPGV